MMKRRVLGALLAVAGSVTTRAVAAPEDWHSAPFSESGGAVYRAAEGDDASSVVVLSVAEISKQSGRPAQTLISEFDSDPQAALEFVLSVMWVDINEAEPLATTDDGAPLLVGDGFTEHGERNFAISAIGAGKARSFVTLIATEDDFDALGGAAFLDQGWLPTDAPAQIAPLPIAAADEMAKTDTYAAPLSYDDVAAWKKDGVWHRLIPGDARSPRAVTGRLPERASRRFARALVALTDDFGIDIAGKRGFEKLDSWASFDGRDVRLLLTQTRFGGEDGVLFLLLVRAKGSKEISFMAVEMTADTYRDWSGVARMLVLRGVIDTVDVFPPLRRAQLVAAPLSQQMKLYEATLNKLYMTLSLNLMRTQAQTTMMLQELNYDLLFGHDISTPGLVD